MGDEDWLALEMRARAKRPHRLLDARAGGLSGGGPVQLGEVSSKRGKRDRGLRARGGKAAKLAERLAGVAAADFVEDRKSVV